MRRALILAGFVIGALTTTLSCGPDDGKAKLYETCNISAPCSADLICLSGSCTRSCSVTETTAMAIGDCKLASECDEIAAGCCKLTVVFTSSIGVDNGRGKGNCTVNP